MDNKNSNNKILLIITILSLTLQTGCSSLGKSLGFGTAVGAGTGAILGGIIDPSKKGKYRTRNVIIGAGVGALAGGLTSAAIYESNEKDKKIAYLRGKEAQRKSIQSKAPPALQQPKVEAIWVESKIAGNRYIEGHFEYIITEPTRWGGPLVKYKNGRNISKNVINAIRFVGKVGSMERDTWYELFSHGTLRWRQMQLQGLIAKKIFKYHTSRHGHNALVIDSFGTKLIKEQGWQHVHTVYPHEIEHDVTVAAGVWKLEERGICEKWMTEREMKSQNSPHFKINLSGGESKYPDIVLRHKVEDSKFISAIEYEKTAKSNWRYNKMISAYSESTDFDSILFIVENYGIERSIKRSMKYIRDSYLNSKIDFVSKDVWIEAPHLVNINKLASKI